METNDNNIEKKEGKTIKLKTIIVIGFIIVAALGAFIAYVISLYDMNNDIRTPQNNPKFEINKNSNESISNDILEREITINQEMDLKPIIYLYPEEKTEVSVKLGKPNNITCSYPLYRDGWNVIANPDGSLIDLSTGRKLYSLYWEGIHSEPCDFENGFVVKGNEVADFLEEKLEILGLNEIETEEFIIYWLPKLQENEYNYIHFATMDEINKNMPLEFSVNPDTVIRILMQYKPLNNYVEIPAQNLESPERSGFVAVEWGGVEISTNY